MFPPVKPEIVEFGPFVLRWYGLLMVTAILTGTTIASKYIARKGQDPDDFWDMLLWVMIPGFIGARLYYVFIQSSDTAYYLNNPGEILKVWGGGIHIFGAFILGGIALWLFTRIRRLPTLMFLDAIGLASPIAQAIGRWGNFINQELYGPPTNWPFGLKIEEARRLAPYDDLMKYPEETTRFHALFLYESAWNFLGFIIIFWLSRRFEKVLKPGDVVLMYLIWYPFGRFFIEFLRTDSWFFPGTPFNVVHILSAIAMLLAGVVLYVRHGRSRTQISP